MNWINLLALAIALGCLVTTIWKAATTWRLESQINIYRQLLEDLPGSLTMSHQFEVRAEPDGRRIAFRAAKVGPDWVAVSVNHFVPFRFEPSAPLQTYRSEHLVDAEVETWFPMPTNMGDLQEAHRQWGVTTPERCAELAHPFRWEERLIEGFTTSRLTCTNCGVNLGRDEGEG